MGKLTHGRTVVYNVNYHIVWSTKYRKSVLQGQIGEDLKLLFNEIAFEKGFEIQKMEVLDDHVHIFASAHPKVSASYIFKMLKGISARVLFLRYPYLKKKLYRGHLWNPSTYIETIGHISEETVKKYIEDQKKI